MNEILRPATLGEILDRTANLYRSRFLVLFGIACVPSVVLIGFMGSMVLLVAWAGSSTPEGGFLVGFGFLILSLIAFPLLTGAQSLSGAALCHAAGRLVMGEKIAIRDAYRAVWRQGWRYVGLYLLLLLIVFGVPSTAWGIVFSMVTAVAVLSGPAAAGAVIGTFLFLLFAGAAVYVFWMLTRLSLAFPISVIEQAGVGIALKRSGALTRGTRWRILVVFLLGLVLSWVASIAVMLPFVMIVALVPWLNNPEHMQMLGTLGAVGMYGAWFAVQALTMPVYAIALVLFYYDQRVRQEGFDIEVLMSRAGMMGAVTPTIGPELPDAASAQVSAGLDPVNPPEPAVVESRAAEGVQGEQG